MSLVKRNPAGTPTDIPQPSMAWWVSGTATIIKYSLLGALLLVLFLWLVIGSIHARSRLNKGLEPLRYHRWLVPKSHRPIYWQQNSPTYYRQSPRQTNQPNPDPPPQYSTIDMPPVYQPPKAKGSDDWALPLPAYAEHEGESSRNVGNESHNQRGVLTV